MLSWTKPCLTKTICSYRANTATDQDLDLNRSSEITPLEHH